MASSGPHGTTSTSYYLFFPLSIREEERPPYATARPGKRNKEERRRRAGIREEEVSWDPVFEKPAVAHVQGATVKRKIERSRRGTPALLQWGTYRDTWDFGIPRLRPEKSDASTHGMRTWMNRGCRFPQISSGRLEENGRYNNVVAAKNKD